MMYKKLLYATLFSLCLWNFSFAQIEHKGLPMSFSPTNFLNADVSTKILPTESLDVPRLMAEDQQELEDGMPLRFAHVFEVNYNLDNSGQWETLANGDRVWRLTIHSPGALNLNFAYHDFFMPKGAYFHIYNEEKDLVQGAFTEKNNKTYRQFATRLIEADKVTLEYYEPAPVIGQGELAVSRIGHGYRDLDSSNGTVRSGDCQVNINCPEGNDWQTEKKGIARILMDQAFLCSGTLINNVRQDFTPYFSIANHCIVGTGHDAITNPGVPLYIFYWNFECAAPLCISGTAEDDCGFQNETTQGGNIVASSGGTPRSPYSTLNADFALILLDDNPKDSYEVYFNGFDRRGPAEGYAPDECIGIHHPSGDEKKISTDTDGAGQDETDDNYWKLFWEATESGHSVTEGGSSGSPLFDKMTKRVIGQLFGGSSLNCDDPANDTGLYGGYYYSWENAEAPVTGIAQRRLKDWLDPDDTGTMFVDGLDPNGPDNSLPTVSFASPASTFDELAEVDANCYPYKDYTVDFKITKAPSMDATASIFVVGGAEAIAGGSADFEVLNNTIIFPADGSNNEQQIIVRVYDDPVVENAEETFTLDYTLDVNGGDAVETPANHQHTVTITDNDQDPEVGGASLTVSLLEEDFSGDDFSMWQTVTTLGDGTNQWVVGEEDVTIGGSGIGTTANAGMNGTCAFVSNDAANNQYNYSDGEANTILFAPVNGVNASNIEVSFIWACVGEDEGNPLDFGLLVYSLNGTDFTAVPGISHFSNRVTATGMAATKATLPPAVEGQAFFIGFQWINDPLVTSGIPLAIDDIMITADINQTTDIRTAVNDAAPAEAQLDAMTEVHFYDPTDNSIMMTITNQSDFDFNCTEVFVENSGTSAAMTWQTDRETTEKTYRVSPTDNATNQPYQVTLYYTQAEIDGWVANNTLGDDRSALKMVKTSGNVNTQDGSSFEVADVVEGTFGTHYTYTATFNSGFSGFALGNLEAPSLAVQVLDIEAQALKNSIQVQWTTATEQNNKGFSVERATQLDEGFETIAWLEGQGNSQTPQSYQFEDKDVKVGQLYYYRLQQTDLSGQKTSSIIVSAKVEQAMTVELSPNPASQVLWVDIEAKKLSNGYIRVVDMLGQIVHEEQLAKETKNLLPLDLTPYASGVYILQVFNDNNLVYHDKFVKE